MRELLALPRFRAFWLGQATGICGDGLTLVALPALLLPVTGPAVFGLVLAVESAAMGLLLVLGGVVADRYSRTAVLAASDVLRAAGVAGYLVHAGRAPLPALLAGAAVIGAGIALQVPARRAALPQLVPEPLLQRANAVDAATQTLGRGVGAGVGGVVVALVGARWLFAVDLLTYAVSLATLLWIRLPAVATREVAEAAAGVRSALARVRREAGEGVREVVRRPWAAAVMVQGTLQVFCLFAPAYALVPIVTQQRYGPGVYGWIMAASAAGSLLGSAVGARSRPRRPGLVAMNALAPTLALPACLAVDVPVWGFCLASLAAWTGIGWFFVLWFSALQRDFPPQVQGRVFSLESLATYGLEPIALAAAPPLAAAVGMTPLAVTAVVVMLASNYLILLVPGVVRFASTASREAPAPS